MRCEYISTILHASLYIVKRIISDKELTLVPQLEVVGEESTGRVDYAIKTLEELICITEGKLHQVTMGFAQNLVQCESALQVNKKNRKRKSGDAFGEDFDYIYGIVTTASDWYFILFASDGISSTSKDPINIRFTESALKEGSEEEKDLRKNVKQVMEVIVGLLKDRIFFLILNTELRKKLAEVEARNVEIEARNAELMKQMIEENNRRDARIEKLEEKQLQNDNTPNNILSNFNSGAVHHEKPLEEKEMDNFLLEAHKKIVSSEIKQRNKEKKLHTESMASSGQEVAKKSGQNSQKKKGTEKIVQVITDGMMAEPSIQDNIKHQESNSSNSKNSKALHMTEISATARRPKCSSSLLDLAKLFDKASDAEYRTKKANEEEILCWVNFGKEFMVHFSELVENSNGKIGEKKAKGIIYDEMLEHLVTIREKRSKEMGIQLPKISRSSLTRRTQRSMKLVRIIEKIGIDKIKYLSEYSPNSISELTNDQIQEIIERVPKGPRDNSAEQDDFPTPEISAGNLETSEKILPEENSSLSADLEDYVKTLTGDFDDETAYWGTPYENEARVEKEEVNESPRVQSNDDVYFNEEVDHDSTPHPVKETSDNDSEEEMPDESDDDEYDRYGGYNEYGECDRGYYYRDGRYERKTSPMMSPIISPVTA